MAKCFSCFSGCVMFPALDIGYFITSHVQEDLPEYYLNKQIALGNYNVLTTFPAFLYLKMAVYVLSYYMKREIDCQY